MNTANNFNLLYANVSHNIKQTLTDISNIHVDNEEGRQHLNTMMEKLQILQDDFNRKLLYLEEHAEWDKFTLAFFGETNAGKSTIIESLRILFNEESRRQLLEKNQGDLEKAEQELSETTEQLRSDLGHIYSDVANKISDISFSSTQLIQIIDNESALRLKKEEEERNERLQIIQEQTSTKVRLRMFISAIIGLVVGSSAVVLINMLMR